MHQDCRFLARGLPAISVTQRGFVSRGPGLGHSKEATAPAPVGQPAPGGFLKAVCEALQLGQVVVISPSLSGMYSLPFLFQHSQLVQAYVPVAPICTEKFPATQYASVKVQPLDWQGRGKSLLFGTPVSRQGQRTLGWGMGWKS